MPVTITGSNTPTSGGVVYGDGTTYVTTSAGTSGQPIVSGGSGAPTFRPYTLPASDGTNGQVLQTNGSGALSFATPSTGALVYVSGTTASSSATVSVENAFTTYDFYLLTVTDLSLSGNNQLRLQLKINGSYVTGTYYYKNYANATNTYGTSAMIFDAVGVTGSTVGVSLEILIPNPANASTYKSIMCSSFGWGTGNTVVSDRQFFGTTDTTGALTGLKFFPNSGTISRGTFRLYGIANS